MRPGAPVCRRRSWINVVGNDNRFTNDDNPKTSTATVEVSSVDALGDHPNYLNTSVRLASAKVTRRWASTSTMDGFVPHSDALFGDQRLQRERQQAAEGTVGHMNPGSTPSGNR